MAKRAIVMLDGTTVIEDYTPDPAPPPTARDVQAELDRRLALGFDYNFGDERGIHRFGTKPDDMERWMNEVTPFAQVLINGGNPNGEIVIKTETGPVSVTAAEWQQVLLAAAGYRQPLYQAYFMLKGMGEIPADFATNPSYWP